MSTPVPAGSQATAVGRVAEVWIYPVKSMRGERVSAVSVVSAGLAGDRLWSVVDAATGEPLTAKQLPTLRACTARLPEGPDGELALEVPGGDGPVTGSAAEKALSEYVGRQVRLVRAEDGHGFVDVAPVHLVSRGSISHAHEGECDTCDVNDPRANLVVELEADDDAERGWVDTPVGLGAAQVRVSRLPKHCLGVYADVAQAGEVREGDAVRLG